MPLIDKGGLKMKNYGDKTAASPPREGRILFMARHMPDLCERLGKVTGRPVIDKTGLNGDYQIELTYPPFGSPDADLSTVFSAVRDQLGLKLESQRAVVEL
jgi:uncharacterized protein (TIGR03435 family)